MDQVLVARVARSFILIVIQMGCTDTPEVTVIILMWCTSTLPLREGWCNLLIYCRVR